MGKHYTIEFKLQALQLILNGKMSIRETARFYNIPSNALVGTWLKRFEKSGIKGLIPRKPSGRSRATEIIQRLRTRYPLKWLLGFAQLARSTFFAKLQIKQDKDEQLKKAIKRIKANHPDYGYRRVHACLPTVNHKKIQRLM